MEEAMHGDTRSKLVLCECGKFHFTYRSMTLHFERQEFSRSSTPWHGSEHWSKILPTEPRITPLRSKTNPAYL